MTQGHEYFTQQEEEISNTYMSANGEGDNYSNLSGEKQFFNGIIIGGLLLVGGVGYFIYRKYGVKVALGTIGGLFAYKYFRDRRTINKK